MQNWFTLKDSRLTIEHWRYLELMRRKAGQAAPAEQRPKESGDLM
jgi:hypothetical protein